MIMGIQSAGIYATISAAAEGCEVQERQIHFSAGFQEMQKRLHFYKKALTWKSLGMIPGDELYFYIRAKDNHGQEKRSGSFYCYAVRHGRPDEHRFVTQRTECVKPEYFRSERQIIIETQQLLLDKHRMPIDSFNNKSNDWALIRNYCSCDMEKFLGEENESNEGGRESQNGAGNPLAFGNASQLIDAYSDKHTIMRKSPVFLKKILRNNYKATLTEMWNAESQLRIYKPEAALPFE